MRSRYVIDVPARPAGYVADDKIYFTYKIRDHASFPASRVSEVRQAIDSTIAEA